MRELGYVEGKNLVIEWRFADGKSERLPALAAELDRMKVELIATHGTPGTQAAQRATSNITGLSLISVDIPISGGRGGQRPDQLRARSRRLFPARRDLRRQDSQGRQAGRATYKNPSGDQSQELLLRVDEVIE